MSPRRWQAPTSVVLAAASAGPTSVVEAERFRDLSVRMPVGPDTLLALTCTAAPDVISSWAENVYRKSADAQQTGVEATLLAAGMAPGEVAYGVLDSEFDGGELLCAVIRGSAGALERWGADGWQPEPLEPTGFQIATLSDDVLADALTALAAGGALILSPVQPCAFLPKATCGLTAAAADVSNGGIFAITDPLDTTAVITLFEAKPGPVLLVRRAGGWVPDDGTLLAQLKSITPPPVVQVPPDQLSAVLRQVDDYDATHPKSAQHPTGGGAVRAQSALSAAVDTGPSVAGLCLYAQDTGRVLMLQRGLSEDDPNAGLWEMPGGKLEDGEDPADAAVREWEEETGHELPCGPLDPNAPTWTSPNGVYQGFVHQVPDESCIDFTNRDSVENPDDPDGDQIEAIAWWDPTALKGNPVVRPELSQTMHLVQTALDPVSLAASSHARVVIEARNVDSKFDADRADSDRAEADRRLTFEQTIAQRHNDLVSEGSDPGEAGAQVQREIDAEDARREVWERERVDALAAEKVRRLQHHEKIRESALNAPQDDLDAAEKTKLVDSQTIVADAVPHTAMPPALLRYWTFGKGGTAKIRWGVRGDWARAVRHFLKYMTPYEAKAAANELHKIVTGRWTGSKANKLIEGGKL